MTCKEALLEFQKRTRLSFPLKRKDFESRGLSVREEMKGLIIELLKCDDLKEKYRKKFTKILTELESERKS